MFSDRFAVCFGLIMGFVDQKKHTFECTLNPRSACDMTAGGWTGIDRNR